MSNVRTHMDDAPDHGLSKWWLRGLALIVAASPPALLLWFEEALVPHVSEVAPQIIIRVIAGLLLTILALAAFVVLERPWLKWDEPTGTWMSRTNGLRYCGTCRAKKLFVPLKNEITGWRCVACGTFRVDPARGPKDPVLTKKVVGSVRMRDW